MMIVSGILGFLLALFFVLALEGFRDMKRMRAVARPDVVEQSTEQSVDEHVASIASNRFIVEIPEIAPYLVIKATQPCFHIDKNGNRTYEPLYITLADCHDMSTLVDNLCQGSTLAQGRRFIFTIRLLDAMGHELRVWHMHDAWVKDVFMTTLDYSDDKPCRVSLTIMCDGPITSSVQH